MCGSAGVTHFKTVISGTFKDELSKTIKNLSKYLLSIHNSKPGTTLMENRRAALHLTKLSLAKTTGRRYQLTEWLRSNGGMILTGEKPKYWEKNMPSATFFVHHQSHMNVPVIEPRPPQ
jgi:hypothetical protein